MQPFFSIIVPIYNMEKYLEKCVRSVLEQSFSDYELLLVDDGSTDKSSEIACRFAEEDPKRIRVIRQENRGLGGARNTGLRNRNGKYVLFLDSDDWFLPGILETLNKELSVSEADICMFGIRYVDESGRTLSDRYEFEKERVVFTLDECPFVFAKDSYIWDKCFKAELFEKAGSAFPDRQWYEDLHFGPKLFLHADRIVYLRHPFYAYRQRSGSIMHNNANTDRNIEMLDAVQSVVAYYKEHGAFERYHDTLLFMTAFHLLTLCTMRVATDDPKHPLLKIFRDWADENFPELSSAEFIAKEIPAKYRPVYLLSLKKRYRMIAAANRVRAKLLK